MLKKSLQSLLRVCYLTDVEGDIHYFNRFMHISKIMRWRHRETHSTVFIPQNKMSVKALEECEIDFQEEFLSVLPLTATTTTTIINTTTTLHNVSEENSQTNSPSLHEKLLRTETDKDTIISSNSDSYVKHIQREQYDDATHFVYGGDVFDHGDDLAFARLLLDFKARYPDRVHFVLGNRDVNKMALGPLVQDVLHLTPEEAQHRAFPLTRLTGSLHPQIISYHEFLHRYYAERQDKEQKDKNKEKMKEKISNDDEISVLRESHNDKSSNQSAELLNSNGESKQELFSDKVTFLQWALKYKMGCRDTFCNRRHELKQLAQITNIQAFNNNDNKKGNDNDSNISHCSKTIDEHITDNEVAQSFFDAIEPGGVYNSYMHQGELMIRLSSLLFVHGGINEINLRFVPLLHSTRHSNEYEEEQQQEEQKTFYSFEDKHDTSHTEKATKKVVSSLTLLEVEQQRCECNNNYMGSKVNKTASTHSSNNSDWFTSEEEIVLADNANNERVFGRHFQSERLEDWMSALHTFKENGLAEWEAGIDKYKQWEKYKVKCQKKEISLWEDENTNKNETNVLNDNKSSSEFIGGEVLRQYCYPRLWAPHSVMVNSFIGLHGPQYATLPVVSYLLQNGIEVVCSGHQPCGDSPTLLFQPPHGQFMLIDGDNSYCNRSTLHACQLSREDTEQQHNLVNNRGDAVEEIIFEVEDIPLEMTVKEATTAAKNKICNSNNNNNNNNRNNIDDDNDEEDNNKEIVEEAPEQKHMLHVWIHGRRSDGREFAFDASPSVSRSFLSLTSYTVKNKEINNLNSSDDDQSEIVSNYLGRRMRDGWWVKLPLSQQEYKAWQDQRQEKQQEPQRHEEELEEEEEWQEYINKESLSELIKRVQSTEIVAYELHRTTNAFRAEDVKVVTVKELISLLRQESHSAVKGELVSKWSTVDLAYKEVHRIKTKVKPTTK